ncbi:SH3 domain-containing protein [Streptomyces sp. NPDC003435]
MRSTPIAISAALLGTLALPTLSATPASAEPAATATAASRCSSRPLPYAVHAKAVTIRSRATTKSNALGLLYEGHKFSVTKKSGNWLYITDKTTDVKGWVSSTYVYRDVRMCLD